MCVLDSWLYRGRVGAHHYGLMFGKVSWLAGLGRWCTTEGEKAMEVGFGEEGEGVGMVSWKLAWLFAGQC